MERENEREKRGCGLKRHQSSLCPLWSGVPVLFLTSTKPSLLGSNQSVTVRQAGGTEWSVCVCVCFRAYSVSVCGSGGDTLDSQRMSKNRDNGVG